MTWTKDNVFARQVNGVCVCSGWYDNEINVTF